MKKIIFLLFPVFSYGQITIVKVDGAGTIGMATTTSDGIAISSGAKTFTIGKLYLWIIATTGTTNPGTVSGTTLTWSNIVSTGNSTRRIQIYGCIPTGTVSSETVTINTFGGGSTGYTSALWEVSGFDNTSGLASAIVQTGTGGATGSNPSITLSALTARATVLAMFCNDANPFGGTNESGWSEDFDDGYSTPTAGSYMTSRIATNDNTPSVTASSRRATITN